VLSRETRYKQVRTVGRNKFEPLRSTGADPPSTHVVETLSLRSPTGCRLSGITGPIPLLTEGRPSSGDTAWASLPGSVATEVRGVPAHSARSIAVLASLVSGPSGRFFSGLWSLLHVWTRLSGRRPLRASGFAGESFLTATVRTNRAVVSSKGRASLFRGTRSWARTAVETSLVAGVSTDLSPASAGFPARHHRRTSLVQTSG
jgi:hypothetical protein